MLKVLHILSTTSARFGDTSVVMNYFRNVDKSQVLFDFATYDTTNNDLNNEILSLNGNVYNFTKPGLLSVKKTINELHNIIKNGLYDIIHLHIPVLQLFVKKAMRKTDSKKLIIHSHSIKTSSGFISRIRNRILLTALNKNVSARFACSKLAGKNLFGKNFSLKKTDYILNNAIDLNKFKFDNDKYIEIRNKLNISSNTLAVCHLGRFSIEKNHMRLIDIFSELIKQNTNSKLFLIGDGPLKQQIIDYVNNNKLNKDVVFLGNRNDVHELLNAMDIYILPSLFEGVSVSLLEAQAVGLLCFASDSCSKDCEVSQNIERLSLELKNEDWANLILKKYNQNWNRNTFKDIEKNGYNIKTESEKLLKTYKIIKETNNDKH